MSQAMRRRAHDKIPTSFFIVFLVFLVLLQTSDAMPLLRLLRMLLSCVTLLLCGCASVQPWERGLLARPEMALDALPLQSSLNAHIHTTREAASGGSSAGGGGCGCY